MNLNQVTLPAFDMQESINFYLLLGFTQIVDSPQYARFICPEGVSTFSLSYDKTLNLENYKNHSVIYFEHQNLDDLVTKLKFKGIKFEQEPVDQCYLWREAILYDPSGNKIKLYWAGENRINPPWRITKTI